MAIVTTFPKHWVTDLFIAGLKENNFEGYRYALLL